MSEGATPLKRIEIDGGEALVYEFETVYLDEEGLQIGRLPFAVDEGSANWALIAYQSGYDNGWAKGRHQGHQDVVRTVHELLGVDKVLDRLTSLIEGKE